MATLTTWPGAYRSDWALVPLIWTHRDTPVSRVRGFASFDARQRVAAEEMGLKALVS